MIPWSLKYQLYIYLGWFYIPLADCVVHYVVNFVTFADFDKKTLNKMVTLYLRFVVSWCLVKCVC